MANLTPVMGDNDIFEDLAHVSATNIFTTTDRAKLRKVQRVQFVSI